MNDENIFRLMGLVLVLSGMLAVVFRQRIAAHSARRLGPAGMPRFLRPIEVAVTTPRIIMVLGIVLGAYGLFVAFLMNWIIEQSPGG